MVDHSPISPPCAPRPCIPCAATVVLPTLLLIWAGALLEAAVILMPQEGQP